MGESQKSAQAIERDWSLIPEGLNYYPRCSDDNHCPGDQRCVQPENPSSPDYIFLSHPEPWGTCQCADRNEVLWKWHCYPKSLQLGDKCEVSKQCQLQGDNNRHCNPLTKRCECDVGFEPTLLSTCRRLTRNTLKQHQSKQMPIPGYIPRPILTTTPKVVDMSLTTKSQHVQTDPATSPTHSEIHHAIKNHIYKSVVNSTLANNDNSLSKDNYNLSAEQIHTVLLIFVALLAVS